MFLKLLTLDLTLAASRFLRKVLLAVISTVLAPLGSLSARIELPC